MARDDETIDVADDAPDEADRVDAADAEAAEVDEAEDAPGQAAPGLRRRALDGRTLAICALVAFIAAALTYAGLSALGGDDGDDRAAETDLRRAEEVPDIVLPRLGGGEELRLSDYRGQPLIVNFWGSWCEPCVDEMPDLQRVHDSLGDQVSFLGVNVNDAPEAATRMVARTGVTYDLARDVDGALGRALEVATFPTTFLIDADGTIVDVSRRQISAERLCEKINQSLLNQSLQAGECG